ncbi:hypothetical protein O7608_08860 [Solwaraspora sp. WMMA2056]|uniref:hypothetical protein n=1 Tax=Solwaraspora sp. WMMA2056 TaxID=3015161 RepID=UPI00259B26CB|nr:hypothetical protein [Solwaraspora sp. WMMA2056]WJK42467.1 hypothetical protein O7608_08860 [Solwaraspora sp. WMMA2056]
MRHVGSLVLSLVLAPVIWFLAGLGLSEYATARREAYDQPPTEVFVGLAALAVCGIVYALLLLPRLSPIGPVVAGLSFLGLAAWSAADMTSFYQNMPGRLFGTDDTFTAPAEGLAVVLAVPLLATVVSPRRWRGERMVALYAGQPESPQVARTAPLPGHGQGGGYGGGYGEPRAYGGYGGPAQTMAFPAAAGPLPRPAHPAGAPDSEQDTMRLTPPGHRRDDPTIALPPVPGATPRIPAGPPPADQTVPLRTGTGSGSADETTRIQLPAADTDSDETTRIQLPAAADTDSDETTRIAAADETVRLRTPPAADAPDTGGDEQTTAVVSPAADPDATTALPPTDPDASTALPPTDPDATARKPAG